MQTSQLMTSWPLHYFIISNFGQGHVLQKIPRFFVKLVITWWMARAWCGNSAHSLGGRKGSVPSGGLYQRSGLCSPPCGLMLRRNGEKDWPCSITEASKQQFFRLEVKLLNYLNRTGWQKKHMDLWMFSSSLFPTFRPQCLATNLSRSFCPVFRPLKMQMWPSVRWGMGINSPVENATKLTSWSTGSTVAGTTAQLWQSGLLEAAGEWLQHYQGAVLVVFFCFFLGGGRWEST